MKKEKINLWQSSLWDTFQQKLGRKTWFLRNQNAQLLAIKHPLFLGYSWVEIPRGPIYKKEEEKEYQKLINQLINQVRQEEVVFIRAMPQKQFKIKNYKTTLAHANHHPETTLKLDLDLSKEELLQQMKPKGRYNIRLAKKKGVEIIKAKNVEKFFKLIQETTKRNEFWGHSQDYYQQILEVLDKEAQLLLARYQGEIIAGGIFVYTKDEAIYYYGASGNQYRNVMAPYLIQWTAIQEAKKRGCKTYDFLGIAPEDAAKNHPWKGVTSFKKKFGGSVIKYAPAQEIILKPLLYYCFIYLKKLKKIFN